MSVVAENLFEISIGENINFIFYVPFSVSPLTSNLFTGIQQIQITQANRDRQRENIKNWDK